MKFDKSISREISLQGIYQDLLGTNEEDILRFDWVNDDEVFREELEYRNRDFIISYAKKILETYFLNKHKVEEIFLKFYTKNPEIIPLIDKAILFLGISMLLMNDVPPKVIIDEVVSISKSYSSGNTVYKMVNKFMDSIAKNQNISQL